MIDFNKQGTVLKNFDNTDIPKIKLIDDSIYKVVETNKSSISKTEFPYLEPLIMEYARRMDVPAPLVTNLLYSDGRYIFGTKYYPLPNGEEIIKANPELKKSLETKALELKLLYYRIGIERNMLLKDILFDIKDGIIVNAIPLDFERIKYNDNLEWDLIYQICEEWNLTLPDKYQNKII